MTVLTNPTQIGKFATLQQRVDNGRLQSIKTYDNDFCFHFLAEWTLQFRGTGRVTS